MPKVTTIKAARKDYPQFGIRKGDTYYQWSFNFGPTMKSKTYPKRSQLTQSSFLSALYDIEDEITNRFQGLDNEDDIQAELDSLKDEIQDLLDETQGNLDNVPEQLQGGSILQKRIEALEGWISDLENIDTSFDIDETVDENLSEEDKTAKELEIQEEKENRINEIVDEISQTSTGL